MHLCQSVRFCACVCPSHRDVAFFIVRNVFVGRIFIILVENGKRTSSHPCSYWMLSNASHRQKQSDRIQRFSEYVCCLWPGFCCCCSFLYLARCVRMTWAHQNKKLILSPFHLHFSVVRLQLLFYIIFLAQTVLCNGLALMCCYTSREFCVFFPGI